MDSKDFPSRLFYWIIFARLLVFAVVTVVIYFLSVSFDYISYAPVTLIKFLGVFFFATLLYILWDITGIWRRGLLWTQIVVDIIIASLIIFLTGGYSSPFNFLYIVITLSACLTGGRQGGTFAMVFSVIGFAVSSRLALGMNDDLGSAVFVFFINMAAYSLTAFVGIYLFQRLHSTEAHLAGARKRLKQMEEINRRIAESLTFGLMTVDAEGRLLSFNQAAVRILEKGLDSFLGEPISECFSNSNGMAKDFNKDNIDKRFEMTYKDGISQKILGFSTFLISEKSEKGAVYGILFQDITNKKAEEERMKRMDRLASLGQMAAGIAHEIRNPLASLSGAAQVLKEEKDDNPLRRKLVGIIEREADRLDELTSLILNYASPEAGKRQLIDIHKECEELLMLLKQKKELFSVRFDLEMANELKLYVDPGQFRQVMMNLLMNAAQSLPVEGGIVRVQAFKNDKKIIIKVSDTGKGIKEEDLSRVFTPFFTTRPDGVGLGLSITHQLVISWGGDVQVESTPGKGTTFTMVIPKKENEM